MKMYVFASSPNCWKVLAVARELSLPRDDATAGFVRGYIVPRARLQPVRLVPTGANGRTAFAVYREQRGSFQLEAIQAVSARARAGAVVAIDHFLMPEIFDVFGLPVTLAVD
jgi:hypothetical protein